MFALSKVVLLIFGLSKVDQCFITRYCSLNWNWNKYWPVYLTSNIGDNIYGQYIINYCKSVVIFLNWEVQLCWRIQMKVETNCKILASIRQKIKHLLFLKKIWPSKCRNYCSKMAKCYIVWAGTCNNFFTTMFLIKIYQRINIESIMGCKNLKIYFWLDLTQDISDSSLILYLPVQQVSGSLSETFGRLSDDGRINRRILLLLSSII